MHTSGFVALAVLVLIIAFVILAVTRDGVHRDIAHRPPPPVTWGR